MSTEADATGAEQESTMQVAYDSKHPLGTTFKPQEAPPGYRMGERIELYEDFYKRLRNNNEGDVNGYWRNHRTVTRQQKQSIIEALAGQLELNSWQKEEARTLMDRVQGQRYSNVGGLDMVAFCICHIVVKDDERSQRYYYPTATREKNDWVFNKIFEDFEFDPQTTANVIQKLRNDKDLNL